MATKLYVGGLPYSTKEDDLKELFSAYGEVASTAVIQDKFTNKSKGFGFVEMATEDEAKAAIDGLDGKEFGGRNIMVNIAREKTEGNRQGGGFRRGGGGYGGGRQNGGGSFRFR